MNARTLAVLAISVALAASVSACSSPPAPATGGGTSGASSEASAPTLTKSTLPTEVGAKWTSVRSDGTDVPIDFTVTGPWTLTEGAGWSEYPSEIVDTASVPGIEKFEDVTFVVKSSATDGADYYYPRRVTEEWVQGLGLITVQGDTVTSEPSEVSNYWPLNLEVGKEYQVSDTEQFKMVATVLSVNSATVPAGTIENTYLVRFRSTLASGGKPLDSYYLLAPDAGLVAWVSQLTGSEEAGFTAAKQITLLKSLPAK